MWGRSTRSRRMGPQIRAQCERPLSASSLAAPEQPNPNPEISSRGLRESHVLVLDVRRIANTSSLCTVTGCTDSGLNHASAEAVLRFTPHHDRPHKYRGNMAGACGSRSLKTTISPAFTRRNSRSSLIWSPWSLLVELSVSSGFAAFEILNNFDTEQMEIPALLNCTGL